MPEQSTSVAIGQVWTDGMVERNIAAQVAGDDNWIVQSQIVGHPDAFVQTVMLPGWMFREGRCGRLKDEETSS